MGLLITTVLVVGCSHCVGDQQDANGAEHPSQAVQLLKNPGFEQSGFPLPAHWEQDVQATGHKGRITSDSLRPHGGNASLKLQPGTQNDDQRPLAVSQIVPAAQWRGQEVEFSGYISAEGQTTAMIGVLSIVRGQPQKLALAEHPAGDWTLVRQTYRIPDDPTVRIAFICMVNGTSGAAWFDELSLSVSPQPSGKPPRENNDSAQTSGQADTYPDSCDVTILLGFERLESRGLNPFEVTVTILERGLPLIGIRPTVSLGRGARGAIKEIGDGQYKFTVMPTQTGEHPVTVAYADAHITRTALVLSHVASEWGQPLAVPGLVNTAGYEEGITVTPDGEYVFVQTGPFHNSGIFLFRLPRNRGGSGGNRLKPSRFEHPWIDQTIGPYTAPERPGFFQGRIHNGRFLHNSHLYQAPHDTDPFFPLVTMLYGFKRQSDGSFAEPFYLAFEDENDAIINPHGLSFRMNADGTATILFSFDDPTNPLMVGSVDTDGDGAADDVIESRFDVHSIDITLGKNNILGTFVAGPSPGDIRKVSFPSTVINFGTTGENGVHGTQGNPHLFCLPDGAIHSIWTDDEFDLLDSDKSNDDDYGDISVFVLEGSFPDGPWKKVVLPPVVNSRGDQGQPFFAGDRLYFLHDLAVDYSIYSGEHTASGYGDGANWSEPRRVLDKDSGISPLGKIVVLAEPTIARREGEDYLYFNYGLVRAVDQSTQPPLPDYNMQAGFVKRRKARVP